MMRVKLSDSAWTRALDLIRSGDVDYSTPWTLDEGFAQHLFEAGNIDASMPKGHLGFKVGENPLESESYLYPIVTEDGKLSVSALIKTIAMAQYNGDGQVRDAARDLLSMMKCDGSDGCSIERLTSAGLSPAAGTDIPDVSGWGDHKAGWLHVMAYGVVELNDDRDPILVNREDMEAVISDFVGKNSPMLLDEDHKSLDWLSNSSAAIGWIHELYGVSPSTAPGDIPSGIIEQSNGEAPELGLWAYVRFTGAGWEKIEQKVYRRISPVLLLDEDRHPYRMYNVAVTNIPAMTSLKPIALTADLTKPKEKEGTKMDPKIMEMLGVESDGEVLAALTGLVGERDSLDAKMEKLNKERSDALTELAKLKAGQAVDDAIADGQIHEAQRDWAVGFASANMEEFEKFLAATPKGSARNAETPPKGKIVSDESKSADGGLAINASSFSVINNDPGEVEKILRREVK